MHTLTCGCVYTDSTTQKIVTACEAHTPRITQEGPATVRVEFPSKPLLYATAKITHLEAQIATLTSERDAAIKAACEIFAFDDGNHWKQYSQSTRELLEEQTRIGLEAARRGEE